MYYIINAQYFSLKISLSLRIEIGAVGMVIIIIKNEKNNG